MSDQTDHARDQAGAQLASIVAMVAALYCDFDRLEELRGDYDDFSGDSDVIRDWPDAGEFEELKEQAGDCESREDAAQRIQEDALEVQVRGGWYNPYEEAPAPAEFFILLCTGGPAVRIRGELDEYGTPDRAWLEYQDWGTPWMEYTPAHANRAELLSYAREILPGF